MINMGNPSLIIAMTGASGIIYALRLLERSSLLKSKYREIHVIYTSNAVKVALHEENLDLPGFLSKATGVDAVYRDDDLTSRLASSSNLVSTDMVIVPASMNTVAKIANGIQDNLVTRVADSILRLRNRLIVVFRETPLSAIDLFNLYRLALSGAIVVPASPGFYIRPGSVEDLVDFIVGKVLDVLGVEHNLYKRWAT